jgi:polar amino acid transport system substrate-binding protein
MKIEMRKMTPATAVRMALAGALALCTADVATAADLADLRKAGKITAGYANTVPFSFQDKDGKLTGQAIELARAAFGDLNVKAVDGVLIDFAGLIPALQAKQFDVIAASMAIRPARCQQVLFSDPYSAQPMLFVYRDNSTAKFTDFASIAAAGARFGGQAGAVEVTLAKQAGVKEVVEFPDLASLLDGMKARRADVMVSIPIAVDDAFAALGPGFTKSPPYAPMVDGKPGVNFQAFAFRKEDVALRDAFNAEVKKLRDSGRLAQIFAPFKIGPGDIELGAKYTADQLCKE